MTPDPGRGLPRSWRACVLALALVLAGAATAAAQETGAGRARDTLSAEQRALARLRQLAPVGARDTVAARPDTVLLPHTVTPMSAGPPTGAGGAAGIMPIPRDSVVERLLSLSGYIATEYVADTAIYQADSSRLELRGSPRVTREGTSLAADSLIVYHEALGRACGFGQPVLESAGTGNPVLSDQLCFDVVRRVGSARGVRTSVSEGVNWELLGEDVYFEMADNAVMYSRHSYFSDCDLPWGSKHYHFGAHEVKVIRGNIMVARNVTLNFDDVPVFWLPFLVQSLSQGRRSGVLMPRFGINDIARSNVRYSRRIEDVGFYWAINDNMGAEMALDWFSDNWTGLRSSLDYNWVNHFFRGGFTLTRYWRDVSRELTLASQNSWEPGERTRLSVNANYTTSSRFVRDQSFDQQELMRSVDSHASMGRRFDWASLQLGASRRQFLSDGTVNWLRPSLGLSFSPLTLFDAAPGAARWYSNATLTSSLNATVNETIIDTAQTRSQTAQSRRDINSNMRGALSFGSLSLSQSFRLQDETAEERLLEADTLAGRDVRRADWSTGVSYQQRLIGSSTFSPGISLSGSYLRNELTANQLVAAPTRVSFSAALRTDIFGFWPGIGPFSRLRHRLSPTLSYAYSPIVRPDALQREVFGAQAVSENSALTITLSQTWEAKYRAPASADSAAQDTTVDLSGEPRARPQTGRTITLLSLSTSALMYDFVQARTAYGLQTTQISSNVTSDLLRGLQLSFAHDLFRQTPPATPGGIAERSFAPHLSRLSTSFSLDNNSALFRMLRRESADSVDVPPPDTAITERGGPAIDRTESERGLVGSSRRTPATAPRGAVGSWSAQLSYTLVRPREGVASAGNQMITSSVSTQPTENWTLRWRTGYSFTQSQFTDHLLTLTRSLHDWDANFNFIRTQNGNFSFQFHVSLRANPDIKFDYEQNDVRRPGGF